LASILTGIDTLEQHQQHLQQTPEDYRPAQCPHCCRAGLWRHGCYGRKVDRDRPSSCSLNPVPIPRFLCRYCQATCSTLPECIPPRRWYLWSVQQAALQLLLAAVSLLAASAQLTPSRRTLGRWWRCIQAGFADHAMSLRARLPRLGRMAAFRPFWQAWLAQGSLARAMAWLQQDHAGRIPHYAGG
jgi:hypothetical protein